MRLFILLVIFVQNFSILFADSSLKRKPFLGLALKDADQEFPCFRTISLVANGSAANFPIENNDCIITIDQNKVENTKQFLGHLSSKKTGDVVVIKFKGKNGYYEHNIPLIGRPLETDPEIDFRYTSIEHNKRRVRIIESTPKNAKNKLKTIIYFNGVTCSSIEIPKSNNVYSFKELIYGLTKSGYRVIRYDRSGTGDSEGNCATLNYNEEVEEGLSVLNHIKSSPQIDVSQVYLLGLSNGASIAIELASRTPVTGLMLYGMVTKPWFEYVVENARYQETLSGKKSSEVNSFMRDVIIFYSEFLLHKKSLLEIKQQWPREFSRMASNYDSEKNTLYTRNEKYFQQLQEKNVFKLLEDLNCKTLIMWGQSDFIARRNDHLLAKNAVKSELGTLVEIKEADHFMYAAASEKDSMNGKLISQWQPNILTTLNIWLEKP